MFLSKDSLKKLYSKLNCLVPEKMVDGKTIVSAIRYFLATDEFKKNEQRSCDTNKKEDDEKFVNYVGHVVFLSKEGKSASLYTKNFAELLGTEKDYKVQSNFFTQGQVRISKATKRAEPYPSGSGNNALLVCDDGVVDIAKNGYQVFAEKYLQNDLLKFTLLFIWLNRYTGFNSSDTIYEDFLNELQKNYTKILCETLQWNSINVKQTFDQVISEYTFEDGCSYLEKNDIVDDEFTQLLKNLGAMLNEGANKNRLNEFLKTVNLEEIEKEDESGSGDECRHSQIIYYGVPGCGKSHQVNKKIKSIPDYNKIRTVFHPEYTNADFIGQILPEVCVDTNGHSVVEYKFNPGPFTEIIHRAYLNPDEEFFLVIEEINRGNAAAIFGEMFQLLDRLDADENPKEVSSEHIYGKGWSSYGIDNPDINAYIRNQLVISSERPEHCSKVSGSGEDANPRLYKSIDIESGKMTVTWREKNGNGFTPKPNHLHFSANTAIRLPPNVSIYATMNTSDQNVFTLDNAFQRRWDMELIPNTCNWNDVDHKNQAQLSIGNTDICWETFREAVNAEISGGDFFNADDKQLGLFFIEANGKKIDEKKFANKVLKYLWTDVFKRNTDKIFKAENLSKAVEDFTGADAFDKVFIESFVQSLKDVNEEIKNK
ncbi:AAA family ATPase [Fibrobacter sp. UWB12]|uniref:AAA family ATPase n=1 Tax=Fibrobacter sp. UWB12 TaxID=1896203 RepID=UPI00091E4EAC|nr:AAA family ATPase [Fibrobacter sp. UWB12]SHK83191.1 AAA domain (dynein-related subfamily) [Fibrobacter sp. UWB12]